jgi:hypothetical protein
MARPTRFSPSASATSVAGEPARGEPASGRTSQRENQPAGEPARHKIWRGRVDRLGSVSGAAHPARHDPAHRFGFGGSSCRHGQAPVVRPLEDHPGLRVRAASPIPPDQHDPRPPGGRSDVPIGRVARQAEGLQVREFHADHLEPARVVSRLEDAPERLVLEAA